MYPNLISALQGMSKALELVQAVTLENARAISRKRTFFYDPRKHLKPITNLDIGTHQAYLENDAKVYFLVGQLVPPKEIEWEFHASLWHLMSDLYGANGYINNAESLLNKPLNNQFFSRMLTTFFVRSVFLKTLFDLLHAHVGDNLLTRSMDGDQNAARVAGQIRGMADAAFRKKIEDAKGSLPDQRAINALNLQMPLFPLVAGHKAEAGEFLNTVWMTTDMANQMRQWLATQQARSIAERRDP